MKKELLLSLAILAAVGSTSLNTYTAEKGRMGFFTGKSYRVYSGLGNESLRRVFNKLYITLGNHGGFCLDVDTQEPDAATPDTNGSGTTKPQASETPAAQKPQSSEAPATQKPNAGVPDTVAGSYAEQVVKLVNEERAKAGLSELKMQTDITAAANIRAREIKQSFSHTRPNGSSFASVLKEQGVSFSGSGENIAWGQKTPQQVMNGWMNSSGHRANILNKSFKNIGVGYYQDENGVNYWVQLFTY